MTVGGWIIMTLSVGFVTVFFGWCVWKVVSTPGSTKHMHSQMESTPDVESD